MSSKSHQRIFKEAAMKHQWFRVYTTKTLKIKICHRNRTYQGFKYVSPKNHQRIFNEAATKHQWFRVYTTKTTKINKVSIEIINVSITSLQKSPTNHLRSSSETSMFWRLAQINFCHQCLHPNHQNLIKDSSQDHQRLINLAAKESTFWWLSHLKLQRSLEFASKSLEFHQWFFKESSTNLQRRSNETWMNQRLTQQKRRRSKKLPMKITMLQRCLSKYSSTIHRRNGKETSMFRRLAQKELS